MEKFVNGSDMLLSIGGKAIGSCDQHKCSYKNETKSRTTKPAASAPADTGKWDSKTVTKKSITINASGFVMVGEKETTYAELLAAWKGDTPVQLSCFHRTGDETPYLQGNFIITDLEETHKAGEDSTYSVSLENSGAPTVLDGSLFAPAGAAA